LGSQGETRNKFLNEAFACLSLKGTGCQNNIKKQWFTYLQVSNVSCKSEYNMKQAGGNNGTNIKQ
jgi:hypothetical protein